ncbi:hypothetical protein [Actinomadura violacea]|uniref:Uncharacterized protein n=1 Tax=Actinomadura violacea TaxID=2819934 RepID=A0ABS3RN76_9ACTN|nr:hypothetical protein [Actinomadura violacea]MBO2458212.1 hypothetical protein [Actinomadura violacea]
MSSAAKQAHSSTQAPEYSSTATIVGLHLAPRPTAPAPRSSRAPDSPNTGVLVRERRRALTDVAHQVTVAVFEESEFADRANPSHLNVIDHLA